MHKRKKVVFIILVCLILIFTTVIVYLNNVFLPNTAKNLIVKSIENTTNKRVVLDSVRINIFKGIVLKDLTLYDNEIPIISVKEVSCLFWFWGIIQKKIIIPSVNFHSASIFIERRKDESLNLTEIFYPKEQIVPERIEAVQEAVTEAKPAKGFSIEIYKINIIDSVIRFKDSSLQEAFILNLNNVDTSIYLSLPGSLKFKGSLQSPGNAKPNVYFNGEFKLPQSELKTNLIVKNIRPVDFRPYYDASGVLAGEGTVDAAFSLAIKDNLIDLKGNAKISRMDLKKDYLSFLLNADTAFNVIYALESKQFSCRGRASFTDTSISGWDPLGIISIKKATLDFNDKDASSNDILASVFNTAINAKLNLSNFIDPTVRIDLTTSIDLIDLKELLKDKFNLIFPAKAEGRAAISLGLLAENLMSSQKTTLNGSAAFTNASLILDKVNDPIQDITGKIDFTLDQLKSKDLYFKYQDTPYRVAFLVNNFQYPQVSFEGSSAELMLKGDCSINKANVLINNISGQYLNSAFKLTGAFNSESLNLNLSGELAVMLEDLGKPLLKFKEVMEKAQPKGVVNLKFSLAADTKDMKTASIDARLSSPQVSIYGFRGENLNAYYRQQAKQGEVPFLTFDLYGGKASISASLNFKEIDLPYSVILYLQGVKIEELKLDTEARTKDISGTVNGGAQLSGFVNDLSRLSGTGSLDITKGKLWELDLFKGMGRLLFSKDFANIVFSEGSCSFVIKDKYISTENLLLKSSIASLSGKAKIGFDNSIDAALNINIIDELVPLTGTIKDLTTTVIGKSGKFAAINITGTLKEPKYKFKPAVENIIKGLTDTLKKAIGRKQPVE
ncbi:MAG: DUF748 domain-containing protein [Candidatus Omnitrophica bacterium]|nr:DUF748 domain-containing protein [Candidatus Omnitrophota bacterium]